MEKNYNGAYVSALSRVCWFVEKMEAKDTYDPTMTRACHRPAGSNDKKNPASVNKNKMRYVTSCLLFTFLGHILLGSILDR